MKKPMIILGICGLTALTGCASDMADRDIYEESGNTINVNNDREDLYDSNANMGNDNEDFGYVRHQKNPIMGQNMSYDKFASVDREQMADLISKLSVQTLDDVDDVATLVTDEEVLIAYTTNSNDRNATADQVKRTAMSVVPRYYHVYVTDDKSLMKNVENFATLDSDSRGIESMIDGLVHQMLKSPQGRKMDDGENANGEAEGELNDDIDRDDMSEHRQKYENIEVDYDPTRPTP